MSRLNSHEGKRNEKDRIRKKYNVHIDPENYQYIPETKVRSDYYDNDSNQRVAVYVRVSTDDPKQTTSYELQKKYYEDFVVHHPNWEFVGIYADEGISGTSLLHRNEFNRMIADCKSGKIDLIITKSVSRFARNIMDCIGMVRNLEELKNPVGVFFESECLFSLNQDTQMTLSFLATMAEEESHIKSRSMETSLRMRLDNGIPLTPKLLGYTHDADGQLIVNPEEAPTVKLVFYMYLYGYTTHQIADALIALGRRSYLGNIKWTSSSVCQILRNERHCGDVLTRKTFTPNFRTHLSKKNRGDRPQSRYYNHHEAIISRDDFIAVQHLLDNAKYGNKSILPELRVIDSGILKGFVTINPRWAGFKSDDYLLACRSVYSEDEVNVQGGEDFAANSGTDDEVQIEVAAGDFDLSGFEVARTELFDTKKPTVSFEPKTIKFGAVCIKKFSGKDYVELLIHPLTQRFAVRPADSDNRNAVVWSRKVGTSTVPKQISAAAFSTTLYSIFNWNENCKYRINGYLLEQDDEVAYVFDAKDSEAFFKSDVLKSGGNSCTELQPMLPIGTRVRAIPESWTKSFGKQYYLHELSIQQLENQSEDDWQLRIQGQLFETGKKINVTGYDELKSYIQKELRGVTIKEVQNE